MAWLGAAACTAPVFIAVLMSCGGTAAATSGMRPLLIAHRGSPCELPEETLEGYQAAFDHGVDFIELDAVSTRDGHLVCRHGPTLDDSTNVLQHPEFAKRRRSQVLPGGRNVTGCFTADFTLAEVRRLRARQALAFRGHEHDGKFRVPMLAEVLQLVSKRAAAGLRGGAYVETKEPAFHDTKGLSLEVPVVAALMAAGLTGQALAQRIVLQSFEEQSLRKLHAELQRTGAVGPEGAPPLTWLFDCGGAPIDAQLDAFAKYGQGVAPEKGMLEGLRPAAACGKPAANSCSPAGPQCAGSMATPPGGDSSSGSDAAAAGLLRRAAARGLYVHLWTVRQEKQYLPRELPSAAAELDYLAGPAGIGVQGVILDCPAAGAAWLRSHKWEGTAPMLQAAAGAVGAATGQTAGVNSGSGSWFGLPTWDAALAAVLAACLLVAAGGLAAWLWQRRRHSAKRYNVFPDIVPVADYADFGRRQLSSMHVPPSPMLRTGDLQLTALPPESPFGLAHDVWNPGSGAGTEHDALVYGVRS